MASFFDKFNTSDREDIGIALLLPTKLVIFGTPTHYFFTVTLKKHLKLILQQKTEIKSWRWQILPQIKPKKFEFYDYHELNEFMFHNFFPDLKIEHSSLELKKVIFRTAGLTIYRAYDKKLLADCSVVYSDIDHFYPAGKKEAILKSMIEIFKTSHHPNLLQIYYVTQTTDNKLLLVAEDIGDEIATLREWMNPESGYLYEDEHKENFDKILNLM